MKLFRNIIIQKARRSLYKKNKTYSLRQLYHEIKLTNIELTNSINRLISITIGIISAGFGLKGFLLPNSFIERGAMGISLLVAELSNISLSVLIVAVNLPFIVLAYYQINNRFAINSIVSIVILALVIYFVPYPVITSDKLLIAVFGGFFLGLGIGMTIRGAAVIDGSEVLAIYLSRKTGATIGDITLIFNILIFSIGAYVLSFEIALYSVLTYIAASRTASFIIEGIEEYTACTIISNQSKKIRRMIADKLGRGVTIYSGKGGHGKKGKKYYDIDILYTIITRLEVTRLRNEIAKIDRDAFVVMNSIKDAKGGMIKKRPLTT